MKPAFLYLHGFASSARSTKGQYFADRLGEYGFDLRCPDFNLPRFQTLTITRMLDQLSHQLTEIAPEPVVLIGSSLGGALAVLAAARWPERISKLVLLAPALMIARPGHHLLPPGQIAEWQRRGSMEFFHYAEGKPMLLDVAFYEDSLQYDPFSADIRQPTLVLQGSHDEVVRPENVEAWAKARDNMRLVLLDDDHQLTSSLPVIWGETRAFLDLREEKR